MNAGSIEISVEADYEQLQSSMEKSVKGATKAGAEAGSGFGGKFAEAQSKYIDKAIADISNKMRKAFGAVAIGTALSSTLEKAAAGSSFSEAIVSSIKSIPIIGLVATIIESGIKLGAGAYESEQRTLRGQQRLKEAEEGLRIALDNEKKIDDGKKASELARQDGSFRLGMERAKASGDAVKLLEESRFQENQLLWREQQEKLLAAKSDTEKKNLDMVYFYEKEAIKTKYDFEVKEAIKAKQEIADKELKDDQERVAKLSESMAKAIEKEAEDRAKLDQEAAEKLQERLIEADKMRAEAALKGDEDRLKVAQSTGSMATSFGSFTFAGYTDEQKKEVDKSILETIKDINKKASDFVNTGIN